LFGNEKLAFGVHLYFEARSGTEIVEILHRGADKSLARRGRKQATVTGDFDVHISYL
jgi:hypothetical protein